MNLIIPLAGKDKAFEERDLCKPLIEVSGKPIIKWIGESRPYKYEKGIFILLKEHQERYNLEKKLKGLFGNKIRTIVSERPTNGAPQSVLLAKEFINNKEELVIDLPDQYLDLYGFMKFLENNKIYDGIIPTFKSYYWNRGYMIINDKGLVEKISEKDKIQISTDSTACISYFKRGKDFVKAAENMIKENKTAANGAFLISLTYNELIEEGKKIGTFPCEFISTLGTIEGINAFEQHVRPLK